MTPEQKSRPPAGRLFFWIFAASALAASASFPGVLARVHRKAPWETWRRASCWPDECFCEGLQGGALIQPANFWSSFAFVVAAVWIAFRMRDRGFAGSVLLSSVFAPAVALVGFSSAYYHASFTFASMIADVQGMQLVAFFLLLFNLRDRFVSTIRLALAYAFLDFLALAVQIALPMSRRALFGATVVLVAWSESRAGGRDRGGSFFFRAALVTLALAFVIWLIDWSLLACSPEAWLQGHAVWHILGAVAAALIAEHCAHSDSAARRSVSRSDG